MTTPEDAGTPSLLCQVMGILVYCDPNIPAGRVILKDRNGNVLGEIRNLARIDAGPFK
jgi:hypothetical protein